MKTLGEMQRRNESRYRTRWEETEGNTHRCTIKVKQGMGMEVGGMGSILVISLCLLRELRQWRDTGLQVSLICRPCGNS